MANQQDTEDEDAIFEKYKAMTHDVSWEDEHQVFDSRDGKWHCGCGWTGKHEDEAVEHQHLGCTNDFTEGMVKLAIHEATLSAKQEQLAEDIRKIKKLFADNEKDEPYETTLEEILHALQHSD